MLSSSVMFIIKRFLAHKFCKFKNLPNSSVTILTDIDNDAFSWKFSVTESSRMKAHLKYEQLT